MVSDDGISYDKVYIFMTNGSYSGSKNPFDPTDPSVHMIQEIPMTEFFTDEYLQDNNRGRVIYCNHKETITIPGELFSGEQGLIIIHLFISSFFEGNGGYVFSNIAINIEYKVLDNIVTIVGPQASIYWTEGAERN